MPPAPPSPAAPAGRRGAGYLCGLIFLLIAVAVYAPALRAPFVFDDHPAIERNASIRHLWPPAVPLSPPVTAAGAAGRPIVNLSLAFNYSIGGLEPLGYRLANVLGHAAVALLLAAVLRGALAQTRLRRRAAPLAAGIALLWLVHPLQTETVICIIQRNEILVAGFFLAMLYGLHRTAESPQSRRWPVLTAAACLLGMASKEVMATAPVVAFLYDRTFLAGSFALAWRRRGHLHLALAATWLLLGWLVLGHEQRAGTAGFGVGLGVWPYLLTQCDAITTYLKLAFWPHPLVADYGFQTANHLAEVAGSATLLAGLLASTVLALWLRPAAGFAAAAFFALLAPSSSFVPLATQTAAEHRMYLPLAAVLTLAVVGIDAVLGRHRRLALFTVVLAAAAATVKRGTDYRSEERLWTDTIAKAPDNPRAYASLGAALIQQERWPEARGQLEAAVRRHPGYADAHNDLGAVLGKLGLPAEALPHYLEARRLKSDDPDIRANLGGALVAAGKPDAAIGEFAAALALRPADPALLSRRGDALLQAGRANEALQDFEMLLRRQPEDAAAHHNAAASLGVLGRPADALPHLTRAVELQPERLEYRINLGDALQRAGRTSDAMLQYEVAVRLRPDLAALHYNLGNLRLGAGAVAAAAISLTEAVRLQPDWVPARHNLALALMQLRRPAEAVEHYAEIGRLEPTSAPAQHNLALALAAAGRNREAMAADETALRIDPGFSAARRHWAFLQGR